MPLIYKPSTAKTLINFGCGLITFTISTFCYSQSNLPACPDTGEKNQCFGREFYSWTKATYVGEFKSDKPDGKGIYWRSVVQYEGEFKDGEYDGEGALYIPPTGLGSNIIGSFKNGKPYNAVSYVFNRLYKVVIDGKARDIEQNNGVFVGLTDQTSSTELTNRALDLIAKYPYRPATRPDWVR
jgi:hypothetical protein